MFDDMINKIRDGLSLVEILLICIFATEKAFELKSCVACDICAIR